jgi:hypothetical protein
MPARFSIVIVLILSLLFGAQAQPAPQPVEAKMPGCAAMKCMRGCCPSMMCCALKDQGTPQPTPMPAPQRDGLDLAALGLFTTSFLYVLPPVEAKVMVAQDAANPHALPRLAVSCIRLI